MSGVSLGVWQENGSNCMNINYLTSGNDSDLSTTMVEHLSIHPRVKSMQNVMECKSGQCQ